MLIVGYIATISVYAFTFGHYFAFVLGLGGATARVAAASIVAALLGINFLGVGQASWLEVITVWGKLLVLVGLGVLGMLTFRTDALAYEGAEPGGPVGALVGAATIFMAYEGFQLLAYDYEDIQEPDKTLPRAVLSAVAVVIGVYVLIALAATSLVGGKTIVAHEEVALAMAGEAAAGMAGKVVVTVAAVFSTASAINATLFATARLMRIVAADGELPRFFEKKNRHHVPARALIVIALAGTVLAMVGELSSLVEAASLTFLFTFTVVNFLAARNANSLRAALHYLGGVLACLSTLTLAVYLAMTEWVSLLIIGVLAVTATWIRPLLVKE